MLPCEKWQLNVCQRYVSSCEKLSVPVNAYIKGYLLSIEHCSTDELKLPGNLTKAINEPDARRLDDNDVNVLCDLLTSGSVDCRILELQYNNITDIGANHLKCLLQQSCYLEDLNLAFNSIGTTGAGVIAAGLLENTSLKSLSMCGNKTGDIGGLAFSNLLQESIYLQKLNIGNTDVGLTAIIAIADVLRHNCVLRVLNINRPVYFALQEELSEAMARALKVNRTLEELHLQKCNITDFGVKWLIDEGLVYNNTLKVLDLGCNSISRDGAIKIASLLKTNATLEVIELGCNKVENDGAVAISESLASSNNSLKVLMLRNNNISGEGICALMKCLFKNSSLTHLELWGNRFDQPACLAVKEIVQINRLQPHFIDLKPYVVDGVVQLALLQFNKNF